MSTIHSTKHNSRNFKSIAAKAAAAISLAIPLGITSTAGATGTGLWTCIPDSNYAGSSYASGTTISAETVDNDDNNCGTVKARTKWRAQTNPTGGVYYSSYDSDSVYAQKSTSGVVGVGGGHYTSGSAFFSSQYNET